MAVRTVLRLGDPRLRQSAGAVLDVHDPALRQLIADLEDTMVACSGAGLAAPQIGVPLRVVLFGGGGPNPRYPDAPPLPRTLLINPVLTPLGGEVLRGADEIIQLTGVSHAEALLSVLEEIQAHSSPAGVETVHGAGHLPTQPHPGWGDLSDQGPRPPARRRPPERPTIPWLTADQLADRLDGTLRHTNQRLAAAGLQQRNEDDDWQLTEAGLDWGVALPLCSRGERRQQILWDPAVVALLHQTN